MVGALAEWWRLVYGSVVYEPVVCQEVIVSRFARKSLLPRWEKARMRGKPQVHLRHRLGVVALQKAVAWPVLGC